MVLTTSRSTLALLERIERLEEAVRELRASRASDALLSTADQRALAAARAEFFHGRHDPSADGRPSFPAS